MQLIEVEWLDSATQDGWQFKPGRGGEGGPMPHGRLPGPRDQATHRYRGVDFARSGHVAVDDPQGGYHVTEASAVTDGTQLTIRMVDGVWLFECRCGFVATATSRHLVAQAALQHTPCARERR